MALTTQEYNNCSANKNQDHWGIADAYVEKTNKHIEHKKQDRIRIINV